MEHEFVLSHTIAHELISRSEQDQADAAVLLPQHANLSTCSTALAIASLGIYTLLLRRFLLCNTVHPFAQLSNIFHFSRIECNSR
jgi:hypothetical protein